MAKTVQLSKGYVALVSDRDYRRVLAAGPWHAQKQPHTIYGRRHIKRNGEWTTQTLHRFIKGITETRIRVDHRNHNGLDNQRRNLRVCTNQQNIQGARKAFGTSSRYKGVSWHTSNNNWRVQIHVNGRCMRLGGFSNEIDAAKAYDAASREFYGKFGVVNFPLPKERTI